MSHYYDEKPVTPSERREIETRFHGINFRFTTDTDVFSKRAVDFGTRLMIDTACQILSPENFRGGRILDLGCGYGVVGIVMKRIFPSSEVTLADINARALELSKINAAANNAAFVTILSSDGWESIAGNFELVLTNPPVRAGKRTVFAFYEGAFEHLTHGGSLFVVLQKKQGAPSTEKKLTELFGNCEIVAKDSGYWILRSIKRSESNS